VTVILFRFVRQGSLSWRLEIQKLQSLRNRLADKGFSIISEFSCSGFNTWGYFRLLGERNNGRPNEDDLKRAWEFAASLKLKAEE
jgi:hypothetical protein